MTVLRRGGVPSNRSSVQRRVTGGVGGLAAAGLLSLLLYATQCGEPVAVIGSGLAVCAATSIAGGSIGFLFGVPRATNGHGQDAADDGATRAVRPAYTANTNLEQVSDWLTKLLIGAGLTQLGTIGAAARRLLDTVAPALGGRPDSRAFAAALMLDFLVLGFLTGWLLTRLLLASALSYADRQALDSFVNAQGLSDLGDEESADRLRMSAMRTLGLPTAEAERYDSIRQSQPHGSHRTAQMQALVDAARETAASTGLTSSQVAEFFAEGSEGRRIYALALMQGRPALVTWSCVLDAVEHSRSAFEQGQALKVAEAHAAQVPVDIRPRMRQALRAQLNEGWISGSTDRRYIAERLLVALDTLPGARSAQDER